MIVGMTGNAHFTKKQEIKKLLWMMKNQLPSDLEVVSLGKKDGADKYIKKFAIGFDIKYGEIIPYHSRWNQHCIEQPFMFEKNFSPRHYFSSHKRFVTYCDRIVLFDTLIIKDKLVDELKKIIKKQDKEYMLFLE